MRSSAASASRTAAPSSSWSRRGEGGVDDVVLDAFGDDEKLARVYIDRVIAEFNAERSMDAEKQLVLRLVMVPDKLALELHELHFLSIERADDLRPPVFGDRRELVVQAGFLNSHPPTLPVLPVCRHIPSPCRIHDAMCSVRPRSDRWPWRPASTICSRRPARLRRTSSISWPTTWATPTSRVTGDVMSVRRASIASRRAACGFFKATPTPRSARRRASG